MRVAGHVTDKMWSKYSQVRLDSVREKLTEAFKASSSCPSRREWPPSLVTRFEPELAFPPPVDFEDLGSNKSGDVHGTR